MNTSTATASDPGISSPLLVRFYRGAFERQGILQQLFERLPPAHAATLKKPILSGAAPASFVNSLYPTIEAIGGAPAVYEAGKGITEAAMSGMLITLMRTTLALFGATPATLLTRVDQYITPLYPNTKYSYVARGPKDGVITLRHPVPMSHAFHASWAGVWEYGAKAAVGTPLKVGAMEMCEGGCAATYDVSWD